MSQWYVDHNGRENGPFTSSQVRKLAAHGKITRDTLVRRESDENWFPASRVQNLFPDRHSENESADSQSEPEMTFAAYSYTDESAHQQVIDSVAEQVRCEPAAENVSPFALITLQSSVPDASQDEVIQPPKRTVNNRRLFVRSVSAIGCFILALLLLFGGSYGMRMRSLSVERAEIGKHLRKATVAARDAIKIDEKQGVTFREAIDRLEKDIDLIESCKRDVQMVRRTTATQEQNLTDEYLNHCQTTVRMMLSIVRMNLDFNVNRSRTDRLLKSADRNIGSTYGESVLNDAKESIAESAETQKKLEKARIDLVVVLLDLRKTSQAIRGLYPDGDVLTESQLSLEGDAAN